MVTVTIGQRWQKQLDEVAELKIEKQQILEDLRASQQANEDLKNQYKSNMEQFEAMTALFESNQMEYNTMKATLQEQTVAMECIEEHSTTDKDRLAEQSKTITALQKEIDDMNERLGYSEELTEKLTTEVRHAERLKHKAELAQEELQINFEKKEKELELIMKSRDKAERHISFLVKEKDRLITKSEASKQPSTTLAKVPPTRENRPPSAVVQEPASESRRDVEVLQLKRQVVSMEENIRQKDDEIQKLKGENWNLLNRLRNKRVR